MTTYRTEASSELGRWKLAIVREGGPTDSWATAAAIKPPELVAVVVNGDHELAEWICALLNGYMPSQCTRVGLHNCDGEWRNHDRYEPSEPVRTPNAPTQTELIIAAFEGGTAAFDHARGAAEALAEVHRRLTLWDQMRDTGERLDPELAFGILRAAAAALGVAESGQVSASTVRVAAQDAPVGGGDRAEAAEAPTAPVGTITWICNRCNRELSGNPRLCPHCGYTVYRPKSPAAERKADQP